MSLSQLIYDTMIIFTDSVQRKSIGNPCKGRAARQLILFRDLKLKICIFITQVFGKYQVSNFILNTFRTFFYTQHLTYLLTRLSQRNENKPCTLHRSASEEIIEFPFYYHLKVNYVYCWTETNGPVRWRAPRHDLADITMQCYAQAHTADKCQHFLWVKWPVCFRKHCL